MNVIYIYTNDWDPSDVVQSYGHYRFSVDTPWSDIWKFGDKCAPVNHTCTHCVVFSRNWSPV